MARRPAEYVVLYSGGSAVGDWRIDATVANTAAGLRRIRVSGEPGVAYRVAALTTGVLYVHVTEKRTLRPAADDIAAMPDEEGGGQG